MKAGPLTRSQETLLENIDTYGEVLLGRWAATADELVELGRLECVEPMQWGVDIRGRCVLCAKYRVVTP